MDAQRTELQERVAAVRQEPPGRRRYGPALKRAVARYGLERRAQGLTIAEIAAELGLERSGLARWLRHAEYRSAMGGVPFAPHAKPPLPEQAPQATSPAAGPAAPRADAGAEGEQAIFVVRIHQLQVEMDAASRQMVLAMLGEHAEPPARS